eukprot:jgi/Mesvir1/1623/Mv05062-RA.4
MSTKRPAPDAGIDQADETVNARQSKVPRTNRNWPPNSGVDGFGGDAGRGEAADYGGNRNEREGTAPYMAGGDAEDGDDDGKPFVGRGKDFAAAPRGGDSQKGKVKDERSGKDDRGEDSRGMVVPMGERGKRLLRPRTGIGARSARKGKDGAEGSSQGGRGDAGRHKQAIAVLRYREGEGMPDLSKYLPASVAATAAAAAAPAAAAPPGLGDSKGIAPGAGAATGGANNSGSDAMDVDGSGANKDKDKDRVKPKPEGAAVTDAGVSDKEDKGAKAEGDKEGADKEAGDKGDGKDKEAPLVDIVIRAEAVSLQNKQVRARQLWGTGTYTDDSDIVAVLMHMGYYTPMASGPPPIVKEFRATVAILPPQDGYISSSCNSIRSRAWGATRGGCSYTVVRCCVVKTNGGVVELEPSQARGPLSRVPPTFNPAIIERQVTTRSSMVSGRGHQKYIPEVTAQYNLCNEPWLKYSTAVIADRGLKPEQWTSFRVTQEVLYVETRSTRYELSCESRHPPRPADGNAGEELTRGGNPEGGSIATGAAPSAANGDGTTRAEGTQSSTTGGGPADATSSGTNAPSAGNGEASGMVASSAAAAPGGVTLGVVAGSVSAGAGTVGNGPAADAAAVGLTTGAQAVGVGSSSVALVNAGAGNSISAGNSASLMNGGDECDEELYRWSRCKRPLTVVGIEEKGTPLPPDEVEVGCCFSILLVRRGGHHRCGRMRWRWVGAVFLVIPPKNCA